jgi:hypothetical protein
MAQIKANIPMDYCERQYSFLVYCAQKVAGWSSVLGWILWCSLAIELHTWNVKGLILLALVVTGIQSLSLIRLSNEGPGLLDPFHI